MEKMIDEIAKLICTYPQCVNYNKIGGCKIAECQIVDKAEKIYKQGYRKQEWISVKDRLPNADEEVLVYRPYGMVYFEVYTYLGDNKWEDNNGYVEYTEDEFVTHWMPLPQKPKMKGADNEN